MSKYFSTHETVTGFCPVQQMEYEIQATITPVPITGRTDFGQKVMKEQCDYQDENKDACPYGISCPIAQSLTG